MALTSPKCLAGIVLGARDFESEVGHPTGPIDEARAVLSAVERGVLFRIDVAETGRA